MHDETAQRATAWTRSYGREQARTIAPRVPYSDGRTAQVSDRDCGRRARRQPTNPILHGGIGRREPSLDVRLRLLEMNPAVVMDGDRQVRAYELADPNRVRSGHRVS